MVYMLVIDPETNKSTICAGAIINKIYITTAAHCFCKNGLCELVKDSLGYDQGFDQPFKTALWFWWINFSVSFFLQIGNSNLSLWFDMFCLNNTFLIVMTNSAAEFILVLKMLVMSFAMFEKWRYSSWFILERRGII